MAFGSEPSIPFWFSSYTWTHNFRPSHPFPVMNPYEFWIVLIFRWDSSDLGLGLTYLCSAVITHQPLNLSFLFPRGLSKVVSSAGLLALPHTCYWMGSPVKLTSCGRSPIRVSLWAPIHGHVITAFLQKVILAKFSRTSENLDAGCEALTGTL